MSPSGAHPSGRKSARITLVPLENISKSDHQDRKARERQARQLHRQGVALAKKGHHHAAFGCLIQAAEFLLNKPSETTLTIGVLADLADMLHEEQMYSDAERYYGHVLKLGRLVEDSLVLAKYGGRMARLAALRGDWVEAESLGWEALRALAKHDDPELTSFTNQILAQAMLSQGRRSEALAHATAAVAIARRIHSPNLPLAEQLLKNCQA